MTQIVETRPFPETFPAGRSQWQDRPAPTPDRPDAAPAEEVPLLNAPPPMPFPRIFPGL